MTTLIQYPPAFGLTSASPFCTKVEVLLRMAKHPFDIEVWSNPRKAPKQKLPVLKEDQKMLGDSTFIRKRLERTHDFDAHLNTSERAIAYAFSTLCEDHLYWCIVYSRWVDNWEEVKAHYFSDIPALVRPLVLPQIRKGGLRQLKGHGMGKHSRKEIYELGARDLEVLSQQLSDSAYFMGEHPSGADATVFSFLYHIIECELDTPLKQSAMKHANLITYTERLKKQYLS